jgi:hypothetical protein
MFNSNSLYSRYLLQSTKNAEERDTVVEASAEVKALLRKLHAENAVQESSYQRLWYQFTFLLHFLQNTSSKDAWNEYHDL